MPPISHLECVGRATPRSTGVDAISIAADDLDTRVFAEPIHQRIGGGIFQQVDDAMGAHIHQNRAVAPSLSERELVDSENAWCCNGPFWERAYHAEQRGAARRDG